MAGSHRRVALAQADFPGSTALFLALAGQNWDHARALVPSLERYGSGATGDGHGLIREGGPARGKTGDGPSPLDLQGLYVSACRVDLAWAVPAEAHQRT